MENTLQKLIELAKADGGKFFVIDEKGEPILVIMGVEEYQNVLLRRLENKITEVQDVSAEAAAYAVQAIEDHRIEQDNLKSQIMRPDAFADQSPPPPPWPDEEELDSTFVFEDSRQNQAGSDNPGSQMDLEDF